MRRAWLRGRENTHKRYLIHVAGFNLAVLMRALHGQGNAERGRRRCNGLFGLQTDAALAFGLIAGVDGEFAGLVVTAAAAPQVENRTSSRGC